MYGVGRVEVDPVRPWLRVGPAFDQIMTVCNMDEGVWTYCIFRTKSVLIITIYNTIQLNYCSDMYFLFISNNKYTNI